MNDIDMPIQWQEGRGESAEIGYFNPNGQQCCGHCAVPGTDHAPSVATCMEQMDPICMKGDVPNARKGLRV
jgi:hypothetical protein